jgi:cytochrome c553
MNKKVFLFGLFSLPLVGFLVGIILGIFSISRDESSHPIVGNVQTFKAAYGRWKTEAEGTGQRTKLLLSLGHFKGLSSEFSQAHGKALLDLTDGSLSVEVSGLPEKQNFEIWLIHNRPGPGRSVKPETGDRMIRAGALTQQGDNAVLATHLDREALAGFKLDLLVVTPSGRSPTDSGLLFAAPNVFQKLYYSDKSTEKLIFTKLGDADDNTSGASHSLLAPFRSLIPTLAHADQGGIPNLVSLLVRGERLFFEETFQGNGRTCGTCHPAENNFTIDPAFIATLPANHPLFVAEFNNDLNAARNGGRRLENPELMRRFGLILENVDGFDDLANKFVMRGTPHTFAQALSIEPAPANPFIPGSTAPFDGTSGTHRTGWSGDGSPGQASLREFAIGAVTQHFTRTLSRIPGVDFRLPSDSELDAIEAFMLSLGRSSELDLSALASKLSDADVRAGLALFNDATKGKCAFCHANAGANQAIFPPFGKGNANFNTGVEARAANLGLLGGLRPVDGGFGRAGTLAAGFGNGTFNTPPLVEAADKRTFFHNSLCTTIECAVQFYTTTEFNNSPSGLLLRSLPPFQPLNLGQVEIFSIAAFLRVINALENIHAATEKLESARSLNDVAGRRLSHSQKIFKIAVADINDAYRDLNEGRDFQIKPNGLHPAARTLLEYAKDNCQMVDSSRSTAERNYRINEALNALVSAKNEIVNP